MKKTKIPEERAKRIVELCDETLKIIKETEILAALDRYNRLSILIHDIFSQKPLINDKDQNNRKHRERLRPE